MEEVKRYAEMNDSGVEWIGEIPESWSIGRIKYNFFLKGRIGWQGLKASEFIDEGPYLITGTDFSDGTIDWSKCYHISQDRYNEAPEIHVKENDLLITKDGTVGKVAIIKQMPGEASLNSHLLIIRPFTSRYNNSYLFWVIQCPVFTYYCGINQNGSIMASLSQEKISNFSFPLPSQLEQKTISSYLDDKCSAIDDIIASARVSIDDYKQLRASTIYEAVTKGLNHDVEMKDSGVEWIGEIPSTWTTLKIKHLASDEPRSFIDGDWINAPEITEDGIRYFTTGNIGQGFFKEQGNGYISEETFLRLDCTEVHAGDLIISRLNTPVGRACIIPKKYAKCIVAVDNVVLRPSENYSKKFIMYSMSSDRYSEFTQLLARGTTMQRISRTQLGNIFMPIPPLSEQQAIADYLDTRCAEIDSLIAEKEALIADLEAYKKSLIYECVTGKRRVTEDSHAP